MNRCLRYAAACALVFCTAGRAQADLISVSLGSATFSAGGDQVILSPSSMTIDLTPGVPATVAIQQGILRVGDSGTLDQTFPFTLSRMGTIGGVSMTFTQPGQLQISPAIDTLTLFDGPTTTFDLGAGGLVDFTPRGVTRSATALGDFPFTVQGTLVLRGAGVIPEPGTLLLLAIGATALIGYRSRRRL